MQIAWARGEGAWHVACAPEHVKEARSTRAPSPASALPQVERPVPPTKRRRRIRLAPLFWPVAIIAVVVWIVLGSNNSTRAPSTPNNAPSYNHTNYAPAETPTAKCEDGTLSYAANHQGACSWHGGVAVWYR
jgi:hypothetical protein